LFLGGTDQARHKAAVDELNNNCVLGKDVHPADVSAAITMLTNRRGYGGSRQRQVEDLSDGLSVVSFAQQKEKVKCYNCNKFGHITKKCPERANSLIVADLMTMIALEVAVERVLFFSQVDEADVKWQNAIDVGWSDSLIQPMQCMQNSPKTGFHRCLHRSVLEDVCIHNNGIFEVPTSRSATTSSKWQHYHDFYQTDLLLQQDRFLQQSSF